MTWTTRPSKIGHALGVNAEEPGRIHKINHHIKRNNLLKVMLKNAAWLAIFVYGLGFIVFLVMLAPAALVVYLMPGAWAAGGVVFALLFAWAVKAALLEPFAIACLMQVYFKAIEGQQPDPEWDARLEQMSGKFRKLKAHALGEKSHAASVRRDVRTA